MAAKSKMDKKTEKEKKPATLDKKNVQIRTP